MNIYDQKPINDEGNCYRRIRNVSSTKISKLMKNKTQNFTRCNVWKVLLVYFIDMLHEFVMSVSQLGQNLF